MPTVEERLATTEAKVQDLERRLEIVLRQQQIVERKVRDAQYEAQAAVNKIRRGGW